MEAKIWYLYHSGFALQTSAHFLIFDYWRDTPKGAGLDQGVVDIAALRDQDVVVFASHSHGDHFNRAILGWLDEIPRARLILSSDIRVPGDVLADGRVVSLKPGATFAQPDVAIRTLLSTDKGVAFIVDVDGLRVYHAGDLNWWHWEGEPEKDNDKMAERYKKQIGLLGDQPVDIAFAPVDPRLEEQYAWGIDYLMRTAQIRRVVPMHFGDDASIVSRLLGDPVSESYRDRIIPLTRRGESAEV